jgi:TfoX/Sxy family transcriptional regulator of competence genes
MSYDEELCARVRKALGLSVAFAEKRMFGGLCFLVRGHMCCGVLKDELVLRLEPDAAAELLKEPHVRPMVFTGRPMRGFLYVGSKALRSDEEVRQWVSRSLEFVHRLPSKGGTQKRVLHREEKSPRKVSQTASHIRRMSNQEENRTAGDENRDHSTIRNLSHDSA